MHCVMILTISYATKRTTINSNELQKSNTNNHFVHLTVDGKNDKMFLVTFFLKIQSPSTRRTFYFKENWNGKGLKCEVPSTPCRLFKKTIITIWFSLTFWHCVSFAVTVRLFCDSLFASRRFCTRHKTQHC